MYVPAQFREERPDVLAAAIHDIQFGLLISPAVSGISMTHLPFVLKQEGEQYALECHISKGNPHWRDLGNGALSAAVFQGPHAYVSPGWYESKKQHGKVVPTWNYVAVHAHGILEIVDDGLWLAQHLQDLTERNEADQSHPWAVSDAPDDYIAQLSRVIVGLRMPINRFEGAWKMIQHRSEGDRLGTIQGLHHTNNPNNLAVARIMEELEKKRSL